jgi:hypothetical protein
MSARSPFPPIWVTIGLEDTVMARVPRPGYRLIGDLTIHEEPIDAVPPHCTLYELVPLPPEGA